MNNWYIAKASIIGNSHKITGTPCQDSCRVLTSQDGQWVSLVVSDGAGTALFSDKSSELVVNAFSKELIELSAQIQNRVPGAWINDFVIQKIVSVRDELRALANSDNLQQYHCTLVACLIGPTGGFLIHIGDGALFGGRYQDIDQVNEQISTHSFVSLPENGEYANETFFITEGDWIKHLRITAVGSLDWIILGTDGGTSIAMIGDKEPKPGFVVPLLKQLCASMEAENLDDVLIHVLSDDRTDKLTSDDKTLCIAFKQHLFANNNDGQFADEVFKENKHEVIQDEKKFSLLSWIAKKSKLSKSK